MKMKDLPNFPDEKNYSICDTNYLEGKKRGFNIAREQLGNLEISRRELDEDKIIDVFMNTNKEYIRKHPNFNAN